MSDYILNENEALRKEIEKLRAENASLREDLSDWSKSRAEAAEYQIIDEQKSEITKLTKQNEIMKKALEDISILDPYPDTEKNIRRSHDRHIKIAKLALQESEGVK